MSETTGVQIFWGIVLFWLSFVIGNRMEGSKAGEILGPRYICKM